MTKRALVAASLVALGITGCSEYLDRRDTIHLSAGEAAQKNVVAHMRDPWPVHARQTAIAFSGNRMQDAVERYRNDEIKETGRTTSRPSPSAGGGAPPR